MSRIARPADERDNSTWDAINYNFANIQAQLERGISTGGLVGSGVITRAMLASGLDSLVGDVTGTIGSDGATTVVKIRNKGVDAPVAGDDAKVLAYNHANSDFDWVDALRDVMTTRGDITYRGASAEARLGKGAQNTVLNMNANDPQWSTVSAILDAALGSTRGMVLRRESASWAAYALGASGKYLGSDGTDVLWTDPPAASAHNLLSATHSDTTSHTVVRGDLITGQNGPVWAALALGASGKFLQSDGTDVVWGDPPAGSAHNLLSATHSDTTAHTVVRGDIIAGVGSSTKWEAVALGTRTYMLRSDGTDIQWADPRRYLFPRFYLVYAYMNQAFGTAVVDVGAVRLWTRSASSTADAADATYPANTLTGTTTSSIGHRSNAGTQEIQSRHNPHLLCNLKLDDNNDGCTWIGFSNQTTMPNTADPGQQTASFRARNGTDTNWQCVTRDSGGTVNTQDSGVAVDTSWHIFEVYTNDNGTTWKFIIDGVEVKSITSNVPTSTQTMTAYAPWQNPISSSTRSFSQSHASLILGGRPTL